jgi:hypothetical protein
MKLTAIYRKERNGNIYHIVDEYYKTKKDFKQDLKANGYIVLEVLTDIEIGEIKNRQELPFTIEMTIMDKYNTRNYVVLDYVDQCF